MRRYLITMLLNVENRDIDGNRPTSKRVRDFVYQGMKMEEIEGIPVKATSLQIYSVEAQ